MAWDFGDWRLKPPKRKKETDQREPHTHTKSMYKRARKELIKQSIFAEEGTGIDLDNDELEKYAGLSDDSEESSEEDDNDINSEENDSEENDSEENDSEENDSENESDKGEEKEDDEESDIDNDHNSIYTCKICPKKVLKNNVMITVHLASKEHKRRARFVKKHSRSAKEIEEAKAKHARKDAKLQEKKKERLEKKKENLRRHRKEQKKRKWEREQAAAASALNIDPNHNPKLETSVTTNLESLNKKTKLKMASKSSVETSKEFSNEQKTNPLLATIYKDENVKKNKRKALSDSELSNGAKSNSVYSGSTKENMTVKAMETKKIKKKK